MAKKYAGACFIIGDKQRVRRRRVGKVIQGIIEWPSKIHAAKEKGKVTWGVLNVCQHAVDVSVDNFFYCGPGVPAPAEPLDFGLSGKTRNVPPGKVKYIKATVKSDASLGIYHYDILIGNKVACDPELEIEKLTP